MPYIIKTMFKSYLKWILRNLSFNKIYLFFNLFGLTIGFAGTFFILIYIFNETSYDKHQNNIDQIYRVISYEQIRNTTSPYLTYSLKEKIGDKIPEIEYMTPVAMSGLFEIHKGNETISEDGVLGVTKDFLDIFTLDFIYGSKENCLNNKYDVILTESMAKKYFGDENPVNKQLNVIVFEKEQSLTVKAVVKDYPKLSTVHFNFLFDVSFEYDWVSSFMPEYNSLSGFYYQYIKVKKGANSETINQKLELFSKEYHFDTEKPILKIQPMSEFYFGSKGISNNFLPSGNKTSVILFASVAIIVLIIAIFNYIILSFAKYITRTKEFGLRKVAGASNNNIRIQILGETLFVVLIASVLGLLIVETNKGNIHDLFNINIQYSLKSTIVYYIGFLGITLFVTFIAGLLVSSKYIKTNPVASLKNQYVTGKKKSILRNILITIQLIVFTSLFMATIVVKKQINYVLNYSPGFNKDNLIILRLEDDLSSKYNLFKDELEKHPAVKDVSGAMTLPPIIGAPSGSPTENPDNPEIKALVVELLVDFSFVKTFEIELLKGRDFDINLRTDSTKSVLLNESAVKALNIKNPIGKYLGKKKIIGIVKDFNVFSLHSNIPPIRIDICEPEYIMDLAIRYNPNNIDALLSYINKKCLELAPNTKPKCYLYNDLCGDFYKEEKQFGDILTFFTSGAILIAILGLFGLSMFIMEKRTKEIGIRKVHGAETRNIIRLISRDFSILLIPAWLISFPLTWYMMDKWLQKFAYQTSIDWWIYPLCGLAGFVVIQLAISFKTLRAARVNSVETLRCQ